MRELVGGPSDSNDKSTSLNSSQENDRLLPLWCDVDLDRYMKEERSWIKRVFVGGKPNRQQTLYWMDLKGPECYLLIMKINLVYTGLYWSTLLMHLLPWVHQNESLSMFVLYFVLAVLPGVYNVVNKKHLMATLATVCSMGVYRNMKGVQQVLRENKTAMVVRTFLVLDRLRQFAEEISAPKPKDQGQTSSPMMRTFQHYSKTLQPWEIQEVGKTFDTLDGDNSGNISCSEIAELMSRMGQPMSQEQVSLVVRSIDQDRDGEISKSEFLQWYSDEQVANAVAVDDCLDFQTRAQRLFSLFDENSDGSISMEEFKTALDKLRPGFSVDEVVSLVNEIDEDGNGEIGAEEFEHLLRKFYPQEMCLLVDSGTSEESTSGHPLNDCLGGPLF